MSAGRTEDRRPAFLESLHHEQFPSVATWRDERTVRAEHAAFLDAQLALCDDREAAGERADAMKVGTADDFLNRILDVGGTAVLAGMRHYGGDVHRPFVDLLAWDGPFDVSAALRVALDAWATLAPTAVRLAADGATAPCGLPCDDPRLVRDQIAVAAPLGVMLATRPPHLDRVAVADAHPDEAAAFLRDAYAAFNARVPALVDRVPPTDPERLEACRTGGALVWWTVDTERAGLLAVERRTGWLCLDGWLVEEEIVAPDWWRRGTAAAAQWRLAERLAVGPADRERVLYGTIDHLNPASRRTAARVARAPVAGWWFLPRLP